MNDLECILHLYIHIYNYRRDILQFIKGEKEREREMIEGHINNTISELIESMRNCNLQNVYYISLNLYLYSYLKMYCYIRFIMKIII